MTVIDIKKQKNHQSAVSFDNGAVVLLDNDVFSEISLYKGISFTESQLEEIREKSEYLRAKSRALWLLDRCSYSERTLYNKLISAGFGEKTSAAVLARLCSLGLIDDREYACRAIEYLISKNISRREIIAKLYQKGIPKEIIDEVIAEAEIDEKAAIRAVIDKKYKARLSSREDIDRVYSALCRKGFSFSAVREVLKELKEEIIFLDGE